jgi:hypothetical protein
MSWRESVSGIGRAVITGGRQVRLTPEDGAWLVEVLRKAHVSEVAVGCATGVDTDAEAVLRAAQFRVVRFPAQSERQGKAAGFLRNWSMGRWADGPGSLLVAFPGGNGTTHMVSVAKRLRLRIVRRHPEPTRPDRQPIKSPVAPGNCVPVGPLQKASVVRETRQLGGVLPAARLPIPTEIPAETAERIRVMRNQIDTRLREIAELQAAIAAAYEPVPSVVITHHRPRVLRQLHLPS